MIKKHFKKQEISIKKQFESRRKLLIPFIEKYNAPVIVHSIHDKKIFHKIITEGKIKIPSNHNTPRKTPYIEQFLDIDNCIYYSLGFVYFSSYGWKYSLIFNLDQLKEIEYYNNSLNFKAARAVVDYWHDNDKQYLDKLEKENETTKAVFNRYYNEPFNGKLRCILEFWKIEKELFDYINNYPHKDKIMTLIKDTNKKFFIEYPKSKEDILENYTKEKAPEMISRKDNDLTKNPSFIGFHIHGKISKDTLKILKDKYNDKIIFDGKRIKKISEIK
ncbi:MAG TPA: hypothetical protein VHA12_00440 [Candidatus Nanoarchaeia archaeon]|nr:hypothetical protein [Candidatus Nanoarchaeia archaeon]